MFSFLIRRRIPDAAGAIDIRVCGAPFSATYDVITCIAWAFHQKEKYAVISDPDSVSYLSPLTYQGRRFRFVASRPPLWLATTFYPTFLRNASIVIYMIADSGRMLSANIEDCRAFAQCFERSCPNTPLIVLVNNPWVGTDFAQPLTETELARCRPAATLVRRTTIGSYNPERRIHCQGLPEILDDILNLCGGRA